MIFNLDYYVKLLLVKLGPNFEGLASSCLNVCLFRDKYLLNFTCTFMIFYNHHHTSVGSIASVIKIFRTLKKLLYQCICCKALLSSLQTHQYPLYYWKYWLYLAFFSLTISIEIKLIYNNLEVIWCGLVLTSMFILILHHQKMMLDGFSPWASL